MRNSFLTSESNLVFFLALRVVPDDKGGFKAATLGTATLTSDARIIEQKTAAAFLQVLSHCLTAPGHML